MPYSWNFTGLALGDDITDETGWTKVEGLRHFTISDGEASCGVQNDVGSGVALAICPDQGGADHETQIDFITNLAAGTYPTAVRIVDRDNWVGARHSGTGSLGYRLYKSVGGTLTQLIGIQAGNTYPYTMKVKTVGDQYSLWENGVQKGTDQTVVDADISTAETSQGMVLETTASTTGTTGYFGNFVATSLNASTQPVTSSLDLKWDGLENISKDQSLQWNANQNVIASTDLRYDMLNNITKDVSLSQQILQTVTQDVQAAWDLLKTTQASLEVQYHMLQVITSSLDQKWSIRENVYQNVGLVWSLNSALQTVTASLESKFDIRHAITATLETRSDLLQTINKQTTLAWNLANIVVADLQTQNSILNNVSAEADLRWDALELSSSSIQLLWSVDGLQFTPTQIMLIKPERRTHFIKPEVRQVLIPAEKRIYTVH